MNRFKDILNCVFNMLGIIIEALVIIAFSTLSIMMIFLVFWLMFMDTREFIAIVPVWFKVVLFSILICGWGLTIFISYKDIKYKNEVRKV